MRSEEMLAEIRSMNFGSRNAEHPFQIMEVCGTHTMSIAKSGLRQLLPPSVRLISGPGCPVCVTPGGAVDQALSLTEDPSVLLTAYGDLFRVPGSRRGDTMAARKACGAAVRMVYSPMDALQIAEENPQKQVVFAAVGFETTAPGTSVCIGEAKRRGLRNFSVLNLMKYTPPAVRALLGKEDGRVDALLCPGHVAAITGAEAFRFVPEEYHLPAVVGGFETEQLVAAVYEICRMLSRGEAELKNEYRTIVRDGGNPAALAVLSEYFEPCDDVWRGLGLLPMSGMRLRKAYREYDAAQRFGLPQQKETPEPAGCCCGKILQGKMRPEQCPLFGKVCVPSDPVGPCMVSSEGACAAAWHYREVK